MDARLAEVLPRCLEAELEALRLDTAATADLTKVLAFIEGVGAEVARLKAAGAADALQDAKRQVGDLIRSMDARFEALRAESSQLVKREVSTKLLENKTTSVGLASFDSLEKRQDQRGLRRDILRDPLQRAPSEVQGERISQGCRVEVPFFQVRSVAARALPPPPDKGQAGVEIRLRGLEDAQERLRDELKAAQKAFCAVLRPRAASSKCTF